MDSAKAKPLPPDFDPVYPYGKPAPPTQPPYINEKEGLTEHPLGALAVHISPPLTFTKQGAIGVKLGSGVDVQGGNLQAKLGQGLSFDQSGAITASGAGVTVSSPLQKQGETISLPLGKGLGTENNSLQVKLGSGLNFSSEGAIEATTPPAIAFSDPLQKQNNTVTLKTGPGLQLNNSGQLQLTTLPQTLSFSQPLQEQSGTVTLQTGSGLQVNSSGQLELSTVPETLSFSAPLSKNDSSVGLTLGGGLSINSGALQLKLGPGLNINNTGQVQSSTTYGSPFNLNNNTLSLRLGPGTGIANSKLTLRYDKGFRYNGDLLALNVGDGLQLGSSGNNNKKLYANVGPGLQLLSGQIVPLLGKGLAIGPSGSDNNKIIPVLGQGLTMGTSDPNTDKIAVRLGNGLRFDSSGAISLIPVPPTFSVPYMTVWTGPDPSVNAVVNAGESPTIRCFVILARVGDMVTLQAHFKGEGARAQVDQNSTPFQLDMLFASGGELLRIGQQPSPTWGTKVNNTVVTTPVLEWIDCMPNKQVYKLPKLQYFSQKMYLDTVNTAETNKCIDCMVILNQLKDNASYAITFRFLNFGNLRQTTNFVTSNISLSYVGEVSVTGITPPAKRLRRA